MLDVWSSISPKRPPPPHVRGEEREKSSLRYVFKGHFNRSLCKEHLRREGETLVFSTSAKIISRDSVSVRITYDEGERESTREGHGRTMT